MSRVTETISEISCECAIFLGGPKPRSLAWPSLVFFGRTDCRLVDHHAQQGWVTWQGISNVINAFPALPLIMKPWQALLPTNLPWTVGLELRSRGTYWVCDQWLHLYNLPGSISYVENSSELPATLVLLGDSFSLYYLACSCNMQQVSPSA